MHQSIEMPHAFAADRLYFMPVPGADVLAGQPVVDGKDVDGTQLSDRQKAAFFDKYKDHILLIGAAGKVAAVEQENLMLRDDNRRLDELNKRDNLTGLMHGAAYKAMLADEIRKLKEDPKAALGVVRLDLDHFSWVNDYMGGHHFGDVYLSVVSSILSGQLRHTRDSAFRVGGDEFSVLLCDTFTRRMFSDMLMRIHDELNAKLLHTSLEMVRSSRRSIPVAEGRTDREGSVAVRELITGMMNLRDNADGAREHFLHHGRGREEYKKALLNQLDAIDFSVYAAYLDDRRTEDELSPSQRADRMRIEHSFTDLVARLFSRQTVSMAGILVNANSDMDPVEIDKRADAMVNAVKRHGGNDVAFLDARL